MIDRTHSRKAWPEHQCEMLRKLYAEGKTDHQMAAIIGRPFKGIVNQRRKMGLYTPKPEPKPIPDDFATWAVGKTLRQIQRLLDCGYEKAVALRDQYKLPPVDAGRSKRIERPADFAQIGPTLTLIACCRHYGRAHVTVERWYRESGLTPATYVAPKGIQRNSRSVNWGARQPVNWGIHGDGSLAASAATHLRRIGFSNVYRATVLERAARSHLPDDGKHHYAVSGRGFMHESEMIALAEANGFREAA